MVKTAAWVAPAVLVSVATPAYAASERSRLAMFSPATATLADSENGGLESGGKVYATVTGSSGAPLAGEPVTFTVTPPDVARIIDGSLTISTRADGRALAFNIQVLAPGLATFTATNSGHTATSTTLITGPAPDPIVITFNPKTYTAPVGTSFAVTGTVNGTAATRPAAVNLVYANGFTGPATAAVDPATGAFSFRVTAAATAVEGTVTASATNATSDTATLTSTAVVPPPSGSATFSYTGGEQTFTVPAGVTQLRMEAYGAKGAGGRPGQGGGATGSFAVTPGQTFRVLVGGMAGYPGGGVGGKAAGLSGVGGYNGGGYSGIFSGSTELLIAGGGGGAANQYTTAGAGGGVSGSANSSGTATGGTQTSGGTGFSSGTRFAGGAGQNGVPIGEMSGGGGGGGGYFGGGGGARGRVLNGAPPQAGAGGSGYAAPSVVNPVLTNGVRADNGYVYFIWGATA